MRRAAEDARGNDLADQGEQLVGVGRGDADGGLVALVGVYGLVPR